MFLKKKYSFSTLLPLVLWTFCQTTADTDVCDSVQPGIYCSCDIMYKETKLSCFIFNLTLLAKNDAWSSISKVENVIALKLQSKLVAKLDYIPIQTLEDLRTLETFTLKEGNLGNLKSYSISGLKILRNLELDNNEITSLQNHAISNLPKLKKLTLSENLLQELLANTLTGLDELQELYLDRNNISRIESCAFCELQNLRELELWGNQITDLTEYTFRGLRYLKRLDLYKNQIRILNDKVFQSMPKLQEIDLKQNLISHISSRAFQELNKLQILYLNGNQLKVLPDEVFKLLPNLRTVELYSNSFNTLQAAVLENMENVKDEHFRLGLKDNPYICDCQLVWVNTYLKVNRSHQFMRDLQEMKCIMDENNSEEEDSKKNVTITEYLKIHNCTKPAKKSKFRVTTTFRSVTKATESVPVELFSSKSKVLPTEDSVYVSDFEDEEDVANEVENSNTSGCVRTAAFNYFINCALLLLIKSTGAIF
ncbi:connectin-like [Uloborus diversus]|uniref:connectin-like n=1 Tax=Uloborus diversus TaxID=327109 RepID=UPI002409306B|nr:connectin-like [Uloborus diversus]